MSVHRSPIPELPPENCARCLLKGIGVTSYEEDGELIGVLQMVSAEDLLIEYVIGPVGAADIIRGLQIYIDAAENKASPH